MRSQRLDGKPCRQVLLGALLGFQPVDDYNDRTLREQMPHQGRKERLGWGTYSPAGQYTSFLQAPCQELHGGSFRHSSEQFACRCDCEILRQAEGRSQAREAESRSGVWPHREDLAPETVHDWPRHSAALAAWTTAGILTGASTLTPSGENHSHSIVPGGLLVMSRQTRLTPLTSLMIRLDNFSSRP